MRRLLRELLPGQLIAPNPDAPDDVRVVTRVEVTRDGVQVWTEGGKQLGRGRFTYDHAVECPDPIPRIIASWLPSERTWYVTIDTSTCAASMLNVTVNERSVFDGREDPKQVTTVIRIQERWIKTWRAYALEIAQANRGLLPYDPDRMPRIEQFGRRRFAEGVRAVMEFIDGEDASEELVQILRLAREEAS